MVSEAKKITKLVEPGTKVSIKKKRGGRKVVHGTQTYRGDVSKWVDWEAMKREEELTFA